MLHSRTMKLELASFFFIILSICLTIFLVKLNSKKPLEEIENIILTENEITEENSSKYVNISVEIKAKFYDGLISTERFSLEDALIFCEENNRRMPADHFKIHVKPEYGTIDDLFAWINASVDISKNQTFGIPEMVQRFDPIKTSIFDEPLWVVQYYFNGEIRNGLFYNIPGQVEIQKNIRYICDDERIDNKTGNVKIHAR